MSICTSWMNVLDWQISVCNNCILVCLFSSQAFFHMQLVCMYVTSLFCLSVRVLKNYFLLEACHYRPQRSCGQGYVFTRVCDSVHRRGGLPQCMLGYHTPPGKHPSRKHPPPSGKHTLPWEAHPPGSRLRHTVNERPVRILLECILVVKIIRRNSCLVYDFGFSVINPYDFGFSVVGMNFIVFLLRFSFKMLRHHIKNYDVLTFNI